MSFFSDQHSAEIPLGCYNSPWLTPIFTDDSKTLCKTCCHPLISVQVIRNVPNSVETAAETCLESAIFGAAAVCGATSSTPNIQLMLSWTQTSPTAGEGAGCYGQRQLCSQLLHVASLLSHLGLFCFSHMLILGGGGEDVWVFWVFFLFFLKNHDHLKVSRQMDWTISAGKLKIMTSCV